MNDTEIAWEICRKFTKGASVEEISQIYRMTGNDVQCVLRTNAMFLLCAAEDIKSGGDWVKGDCVMVGGK